MKKWFARVLASALLLAALAGIEPLKVHLSGAVKNTPPGVTVADKTLVNVWLAGDMLSGAGWVRARAAQYAKTHAGVSVWVRTASQEDLLLMTEEPQAAPDVILFSPDEDVNADALGQADASQVCASYARAGQWGGAQRAVPVYMTGYVLAVRTQEAVATPVPRSLFGVTQAPENTPTLPPDLQWPAEVVADDGFGALALGLVHVPEKAAYVPTAEVTKCFETGAVMTTNQARSCAQNGVGFSVLAGAAATDKVVYGAVTKDAQEAGAAFLSYLLSEDAQRALGAQGLLPAKKGMQLYVAADAALFAAQEALKDGWLAPAFGWERDREQFVHSAQALINAKSGTQELVK